MVVSCKTSPEFTIELNMPEYHGQMLKLNRLSGSDYTPVDSLLIDSTSKNILSGEVEAVEMMFLTVEGERQPIRLLVENEEYQVTGSVTEPSVKSSGKAQQDLTAYEQGLRDFNSRMRELYMAYRMATIENNQAKADSLVHLLDQIDSDINNYDSLQIVNNPASPTAVLALRNIFYRYNVEELSAMVEKIDEKVRHMEEYKYIASKLDNMKQVVIGKHFVDFGLKTPEGNILNVSDVHDNNVLLIDFWAAWCGPCRRANPELVEIYKIYHGRGLEFLGVSLDRDRDSWLKAIEEDSLTWPQISDLQFWNSKGAELYGVSSIPHSVLIDRKGIIRAKHLSGDELRTRIEELLGEV